MQVDTSTTGFSGRKTKSIFITMVFLTRLDLGHTMIRANVPAIAWADVFGVFIVERLHV